jgi:hypothetical protein
MKWLLPFGALVLFLLFLCSFAGERIGDAAGRAVMPKEEQALINSKRSVNPIQRPGGFERTSRLVTAPPTKRELPAQHADDNRSH